MRHGRRPTFSRVIVRMAAAGAAGRCCGSSPRRRRRIGDICNTYRPGTGRLRLGGDNVLVGTAATT